MLDVANEQVIPLSEAHRHPLLRQGRRPGRPIHRATLERWRMRGIRGVILETALVGGTRVTTAEALQRFFDRVNGHSDDTTPSPSEVRRQHARAETALAAAGI